MPLAALIQQEQWFRALVEQSSDAITLVTAEGTILYASPAIARVTGYTAEELIGTNGFAFVYPDELERKPQRFNDLLDHPGKVITVEYRLRLKDGSWRWMEGTATNLLHDPVIGALVVNCRDITERKQAEEERSQLLAREQAARMEAEAERRCVEDLNRQLEAEKDALRQTQQEAEARDRPGTPMLPFVLSSTCRQTLIPNPSSLTSAMPERFRATWREDRCPKTSGPSSACCAENASQVPTRWTSCVTPARSRTCTSMPVALRFVMQQGKSWAVLSCSAT